MNLGASMINLNLLRPKIVGEFRNICTNIYPDKQYDSWVFAEIIRENTIRYHSAEIYPDGSIDKFKWHHIHSVCCGNK